MLLLNSAGILIKECLFNLKLHNITHASNYTTLKSHVNKWLENGAFLAIKNYKTICNAIYRQFACNTQ